MVCKSSIIVNLAKQFTEEMQMDTALLGGEHLTSLVTQETEVKSKTLSPLTLAKIKLISIATSLPRD